METLERKSVEIADLFFLSINSDYPKVNLLIYLYDSVCVCMWLCVCAFSSIRTSCISHWKDVILYSPQMIFYLEIISLPKSQVRGNTHRSWRKCLKEGWLGISIPERHLIKHYMCSCFWCVPCTGEGQDERRVSLAIAWSFTLWPVKNQWNFCRRSVHHER